MSSHHSIILKHRFLKSHTSIPIQRCIHSHRHVHFHSKHIHKPIHISLSKNITTSTSTSHINTTNFKPHQSIPFFSSSPSSSSSSTNNSNVWRIDNPYSGDIIAEIGVLSTREA